MSTPAMRWTRTATFLVVMLTPGLLMAWFSAHRSTRLVPLGAPGSVAGLAPHPAPHPATPLDATLATPVDAANQCKAAGNTTVTGYDSAIPRSAVHVVPRGGTISVPLTVTFVSPGADQGSCRDVTFPLRFSGTATPGQGGTP